MHIYKVDSKVLTYEKHIIMMSKILGSFGIIYIAHVKRPNPVLLFLMLRTLRIYVVGGTQSSNLCLALRL